MKAYLESFNLFSNEEIENFLDICEYKTLKKNDFFLMEDEICDNISFVVSGIFRSFYHSNSQDQITYCFTFQNSLLMAYSSFISGEGSKENIQALTNSKIITIPKTTLNNLAKSNTNWLQFLKIIAEQEYLELEKWIFNHQKDKAQQRYLDLITKQPKYIKEIPLVYIASYLGVTQRHLSRIRANIDY
ncbi:MULTISPECIES: Crp/Fnr family transcriptional regulator [unclassified Cellulophaga]|uniref:Crp/Fnr family transcriptional regulator n=1 Tax=unclassified Cellulophaga TaxID=2634405 RepID=UPI000C2CB1EF|nr:MULTISPECIES: Crp/Fnr family transcriptional regulator [unclassified Cellulophaga]MDO6490870.1 Crp/Fnr family transcriptional regulator [Cellulophaga sp. 2_MG-2023]MDO6493936.1 Crp/Fnr family transcriptional regulator [Cellulophaga sp. 3_MG-2023]PKB44055.1 CRP-like cAMP-binding protein [Cellulophaga sp. RHA19]